MSHPDYSPANGLLVINGINITDWGEGAPGLNIEDIKPRTSRKYGVGGGTADLDPIATPKRITINLLTGSSQARALVGVMKSKVSIQAAYTQLGSVEAELFINGRITSRGPRGRITEDSGSLTDEVFVFEFADSTET